jgi:hypothetical protein
VATARTARRFLLALPRNAADGGSRVVRAPGARATGRREVNQAVMQRVTPATSWYARAARPGLPFVASLLLLAASYVLLIAAPLLSERLSQLTASGLAPLQRWIPAASGAGLALGGGSALLLVLSRLSKDIRRHPYACVAPALAAFAGCVLVGLRAKLPVGASEPLCVFALALAVMGGSLVQELRLASQIFGWALSVAPTACLVAAVWAASGHSQLSQAIWSLDSVTRLFLALLALSSVTMALLGMVARTLGARRGAATPVEEADAWLEPEPYPSFGSHADPRASNVGSWDPRAFQLGAATPVYGMPRSVREDTLDFELRDAESQLRKRGLGWPAVLGLACLAMGGGVAAWRGSPGSRALHALSASLFARPTPEVAQVAPARVIKTAPDESRPVVEQLAPAPATALEGAADTAVLAAAAPALPVQAIEARGSAREQNEEQALALAASSAPEPVAQAVPAAVEGRTPARQQDQARAQDHTSAAQIEAQVITTRKPLVRHARVQRKTHTARAVHESAPAPAAREAPIEPAAEAKAEPAPAALASTTKTAARGERAEPVPAPRKPEPEAARPAKPAAPTRGDESLDELMDRVVEPQTARSKGTKGSPVNADDPIFGL